MELYSISFLMDSIYEDMIRGNSSSLISSQKDAISQLNELGPAIKIEYNFHTTQDGFICRALMVKDRETYDCYGVSKKKQEAKLLAASEALALLKLLFPMVPLAMYNRAPKLESVYTPISNFGMNTTYVAYYLKEIRSGNIYVYVNKTQKNYIVLSNPSGRPEMVITPECPIELLNDPIRFTDWSQGPICIAQENYISRRLELIS